MSDNFLVNFIGIGAPRCATTWISKCLNDHPDICFSSKKETHFFEDEYDDANDLLRYKKYFVDCGNKISGEFTPSYYLNESIARNIKRHFPDIKILVVLRNPVERSFSNYLYNKKRGKCGSNSFEEEMNKHGRIFDDSFYYKHLSRFLRHFNEKQVLVLLYEDISKNPTEFIRKIYSFLGVDDCYVSSLATSKINATQNVRYRFLIINRALYGVARLLKSKYKKALPYLKMIKLNILAKKILRANYGSGKNDDEVLSDEAKKRFLSIYKKDIKDLESLINIDLSRWYNL